MGHDSGMSNILESSLQTKFYFTASCYGLSRPLAFSGLWHRSAPATHCLTIVTLCNKEAECRTLAPLNHINSNFCNKQLSRSRKFLRLLFTSWKLSKWGLALSALFPFFPLQSKRPLLNDTHLLNNYSPSYSTCFDCNIKPHSAPFLPKLFIS